MTETQRAAGILCEADSIYRPGHQSMMLRPRPPALEKSQRAHAVASNQDSSYWPCRLVIDDGQFRSTPTRTDCRVNCGRLRQSPLSASGSSAWRRSSSCGPRSRLRRSTLTAAAHLRKPSPKPTAGQQHRQLRGGHGSRGRQRWRRHHHPRRQHFADERLAPYHQQYHHRRLGWQRRPLYNQRRRPIWRHLARLRHA